MTARPQPTAVDGPGWAPAPLRRWLVPPALGDDDLDGKARALHPLLLALLVVSVVASGVLVAAGRVESAIGGAVGALLVLGELAFVRRGRPDVAALLMLGSFTPITAYLLWVGEGLLDVAMLLYPIQLLIAALLVKLRWLLFLTGLAVASVWVVVFGQVTGRVRGLGVPATQFVEAGIYVTLFIGTSTLLGVIMARRVRENLERARASEARYRELVGSVPVGIYTTRLDGRILYANERFARILEFDSPREALAANAASLYRDPEDRRRLLERLARDGRVEGFECVAATAKGSERTVVLSAYLDGEEISGLVEDVTDRRRAEADRLRLEAQLRHSQKMEAVGTLAGGIAHDFNNILGIILGYGELAQRKVEPGSEAEREIGEILTAADRARALVGQILAFSRRGETHPVACDLLPIVKEALKFLRATLPATIELRERLEPAGAAIVDPSRLEQVLMNLGTNAFHAMDGGGVLEVALEGVRLDEAEAGPLGLEPGRHARISVSDTGSGIPPEILGRIFEPYFTTKEPGRGTGLGLAMAHGIVSAAGGAIRVDSRPGRGTTFHVYLPTAVVAAADAPAADAPLRGGSERILVVDDEAAIVAMLETSLSALGYRVTAARSPGEALARFRADPTWFDAVVTDLTMPKVSGEEVARALLAVRPDLPIFVCTGFSEELAAERLKALGVREVLAKPVPRARLARALRAALDEPGRR